jgi:17beta-estradiol 17-dehydrogenase / very-long-chain 3-oxoacyl-CoA reductase
MPVYFSDAHDEEIEDICTVNINGTLRATHTVLPGMIDRFVLFSKYVSPVLMKTG